MTDTTALTLHREVETRRGRLKIFIAGALLGATLTSAGTFELGRINAQCDRIHAKHRLEELRAHHLHPVAICRARSHP